jgi:hypothetical protein
MNDILVLVLIPHGSHFQSVKEKPMAFEVLFLLVVLPVIVCESFLCFKNILN